MAQHDFNPETYESPMVQEMPAYRRRQERVASTTPRTGVARILDLGTGTGATVRSVLEVHAGAQLTGLDKSAAMLAVARRHLPATAELRVARLEAPLPAGPFDLVVSALAVHYLDGAGKADLFHRTADVLAPNGRLVLSDVIVPEDLQDAVTPIDGAYDTPSTLTEQLAWLRDAGFVACTAWLERDVSVLEGDLTAP